MCIGLKGDHDHVRTIDCARRLIATGADLIGVNCLFDPFMSLETMKEFKKAVDELKPGQKKPHLMMQPLGYHSKFVGHNGWLNLDQCPFGMLTFQDDF